MTVITIHVYTQGLRVHKAENMSTHTEEDQIVDERQSAAIRLANLLKLDGNKQCADCGAAAPQWASCNLGIFLCINCAGTHRNTLGTYISKIKSVRLDSWTMEEVDIVAEMGNVKANAVYEANLPEAFKRPQHDDTKIYMETNAQVLGEKPMCSGRVSVCFIDDTHHVILGHIQVMSSLQSGNRGGDNKTTRHTNDRNRIRRSSSRKRK